MSNSVFSIRILILVTFGCFLLLSATGIKLAQVSAISLLKEKVKIQQEVRKAFDMPITKRYLSTTYSMKNSIIKAYPVCYFNGTADVINAKIDINKYLSLDTIPCYAAIYTNNNLSFIATANKLTGNYYSFYPVNPPISEQNKGLGSKSFSDDDIKLIQAVEYHSESAFFLKLIPTDIKTPNIIAFYEHNNINYIDTNKKVYKNFEDLVKSRYGSLNAFKQVFENSKVIKN